MHPPFTIAGTWPALGCAATGAAARLLCGWAPALRGEVALAAAATGATIVLLDACFRDVDTLRRAALKSLVAAVMCAAGTGASL